ncbi:MAG: methyltransferase domain-containing protein [Bacteroidales bacterium]
MFLDRLPLDLMCCPDCGGELAKAVAGVDCRGCGRHYALTDDGILIMLPTQSLSDDRGQNDPDFQKWLEISSKLSKDYFENGNGLFNRIHHSSHQAIDTIVKGLPQARTILDLGCGAGAHYPYHGDDARVVGLDISLNSLRLVRRQFPAAVLIQGDAYKLPFKPASFDVVMSVYNLEHIFHLDACLQNVRRILAADGHFLVGLPTEGGWFWNGGRALTSGRTIPRDYGIDYAKVIAIEHCNTAAKVIAGLRQHFRITARTQWPLAFLPSLNLNFSVTLTCRPKA